MERMTYYVTFPFTDRAAAEAFLKDMREEGWSGTMFDTTGAEVFPQPRLVVASEEDTDTHSVHVDRLV